MTTPYRSGQALGWLAAGTGFNVVTAQNNAAANWNAFAFIPDAARTLANVRAFVSAVVGTLAGTDITADLYDSAGTNGVPGSAIESGKVPTATINASGWYDFTGFTTVLTANQVYWIVFKNVNGTPASNNCTFRWLSNVIASWLIGSSTTRLAWSSATSTNSGSTWSRTAGVAGIRIGYNDSTYDGIPVSNNAAAAVGDGVYSTRESGVKFTSPSNAVLNARGLMLGIHSKSASPTGNPRLGLWTGSTPVNQGYATLLTTTIQGIQTIYADFASTIAIQPGTICRITLGEDTQSDSSSNRYNLSEVTWDTNANSTPLLPWNGTCTKTYFDGSNWTDSALGTSIFWHALLLDTAGEFGSSGGTSGGFIIGG